MLDALAWAATAGSALSLWIMGTGRRWAWTWLFFNQFIWVAMGLIAPGNGWGFYAHAIVFGYIAIRGWLKWEKRS